MNIAESHGVNYSVDKVRIVEVGTPGRSFQKESTKRFLDQIPQVVRSWGRNG